MTTSTRIVRCTSARVPLAPVTPSRRTPGSVKAARFTHVLLLAGVVGVTGALAGCGGDSPVSPPTIDPVIAVSVTPSTSTLTALGETVQLTATQTRDGTPFAGASFTWSVTEGSAVEVGSSGLVTALENGAATVTVTSDGASASATITVEQASSGIQTVSGDMQFGDVGQPLDTALVARVVDANDAPIVGEQVVFTVSGEGTLDVTEAATDSLGTVTTSWTLGPVAGTQEVRAHLAADSTVAVTFTVTAGAGPVAILSISSGDAQSELVERVLPLPIVVRAEDAFGNPVADALIHFAADAGAFAEAEVETELDGTAAALWTMGATPGAHLATATLDSTLIALDAEGTFSADFTATAVLHTLDAPANPILVAGDTVTLTGAGFHFSLLENTVTVGDAEAIIVGGTQSSLDFVVPAFGCVPERPVQVVVGREAMNSEAPAHWRPSNPLELAPGERRVIHSPGDFCLQFLEDDAGEEYLIGVTATTSLSAEMSFAVLADDGESEPVLPSAAAATFSSGPSATSSGGSAGLRAWEEDNLKYWNRSGSGLAPARTASQPGALQGADGPQGSPEGPAAAPPVVGETRTFRVPDISGDACEDYTNITATVWAVSNRVALLTDNANPPAAINLFDPTPFLTLFDNTLYQVVTDFLGSATDFGGNEKVLLVLTRQVNLQGELGFATAADFFDSAGCASSNGAEIIYVAAPDPTNQLGLGAKTAAALIAELPPTITHELAHVIQFGRRIAAGAPLLSGWIADGQAQLVQESIGFHILGNTFGQNYGADLLNTVADALDWYGSQFTGLSRFYGWDGGGGRRDGAPDRCSLFGDIVASTACDGNFGTGAAWSFVRYVTDRFGGANPAALHQALLNDNAGLGDLASLEAAFGISFTDLLIDWAAALYLDGQLPPDVAPELQLRSWDLADVFGARPAAQRLEPPRFGFDSFGFTRAIVAGGSAYTLLTQPGAKKPLAVRVRSDQDQTLSTVMGPRLWVVRVR